MVHLMGFMPGCTFHFTGVCTETPAFGTMRGKDRKKYSSSGGSIVLKPFPSLYSRSAMPRVPETRFRLYSLPSKPWTGAVASPVKT